MPDVEVMNTNSVTINDNGKSFEIVTKCTDPEQLFLDKQNFVPMLQQVKLIARGLVADPTTEEGAKQRKALSRKIGSLKTAIEDEGKKVAAALKAKPKIIDATRKEVKARQNEIIEISNLPASAIGCDSHGTQDVINVLESKAQDEAYWKESYADAVAAFNEARRQLNAMLETQLKQEEQQREYERLKAEEAERNRKAAEEAVGKRWFERCMEARAENVRLKRALWMARKAHAVAMFSFWDSHYRDNPNAVYRNRTIDWLRNRWLLILDSIIKKEKEYVDVLGERIKDLIDNG